MHPEAVAYMKEIGRKGGLARALLPKNILSEIGKLGGRPPKKTLENQVKIQTRKPPAKTEKPKEN